VGGGLEGGGDGCVKPFRFSFRLRLSFQVGRRFLLLCPGLSHPTWLLAWRPKGMVWPPFGRPGNSHFPKSRMLGRSEDEGGKLSMGAGPPKRASAPGRKSISREIALPLAVGVGGPGPFLSAVKGGGFDSFPGGQTKG